MTVISDCWFSSSRWNILLRFILISISNPNTLGHIHPYIYIHIHTLYYTFIITSNHLLKIRLHKKNSIQTENVLFNKKSICIYMWISSCLFQKKQRIKITSIINPVKQRKIFLKYNFFWSISALSNMFTFMDYFILPYFEIVLEFNSIYISLLKN